MNIKEFTFSGFLSIDWNDDFKTIKLTDENKSIDLVKKFRAIFELFENEVSVSYFISDSKKTEEEITECWLKQLFGSITAECETINYNHSSHTYGTSYNTYLQIGGHDLFDEFDSFRDKYCILKINVKTEQ